MAVACGSRVCVDVSCKRQLLEQLQLYDEGAARCHEGIKMHGTIKATTAFGLRVHVDAVDKSFVFQKSQCFAKLEDVIHHVQ